MTSLAQLAQGKKIVAVGFMGRKIHVEYDVKGYDDDLYVAQIRNNKISEENPRRLRINRKVVEKMVLAWDITEQDCPEACETRKEELGDPICREHAIPVTEESIDRFARLFGNIFINGMVATVLQDAGSDGEDPKRPS